jgi:hypothetical protein
MRDLVSTRRRGGLTGMLASRHLLVLAGVIGALVLVPPRPATAQTFIAEEAYHERFCKSFVLFRECRTVATQRINSAFTQQYLGSQVFGGLWSAAANCLTVNYPNERCAQSVAVFSDPTWNRVVWGQSNNFLKMYGSAGDSIGQFQQPAGVAITRADGEWHVAFVADAIAGRIVALALGYTSRCVKWLGDIDNSYKWTQLSGH